MLVQDVFITATTHLASSLASLDTVSSTLLAFLCANGYITSISTDKALCAQKDIEKYIKCELLLQLAPSSSKKGTYFQ